MDLSPLYQADDPQQIIDAYPDLVHDEVAAQIYADFSQAKQAGHYGIAYEIISVGAQIRWLLGQHEWAYSYRLDAVDALFLLAEDDPAYDNARAGAQAVGARALGIGAFELVFHAWIVAADCSWLTFDENSDNCQERLIQTMRDCANAVDWAGRLPDLGEQGLWLERLASLVSSVAGEAMSRSTWSEQWPLTADALLRRLAAGGEAFPVDMAFESTGGAAESAYVAAQLSKLESRYGEL